MGPYESSRVQLVLLRAIFHRCLKKVRSVVLLLLKHYGHVAFQLYGRSCSLNSLKYDGIFRRIRLS
jgi:hypothetical protein